MKSNFNTKPSLPAGIKYDRKTGGVDGNNTGSETMKADIYGKPLDDAGFQTSGYQLKKDTPFQLGASIAYVETRPLNRLPPGMFIDNQDVTDIRVEPYKEIVDAFGYPGDGWTADGGGDKLGR